MLSEATWFFELGADRFKKVTLKSATDGYATVSVLIYDDLAAAHSQTDDRLLLDAPFTCETGKTHVAFQVGGTTYQY